QYPLVELLSGVLSAAVVWKLGPTWPALAGLVLTWTLVALSGIDFRTQLLPQPVERVLAVQAADRQGRHGSRRLQAAGRAGRVDGAAGDPADRAAVLADRRHRGRQPDRALPPRAWRADAVRPVHRDGRLGVVH